MVDRENLLSTFLDLVQIDSLTFNEKRVASYIGRRLKKLKIFFEVDQAGKTLGGNSGNLIARLPGTKKKAKPILFAAHMDTVAPGVGVEPVVKKGIVRSKGNTILGADNKAGCAIVLAVLETVKRKNLSHPPLEVVFTVAEEKGLLGAKQLNFKKLRSKIGFVMDGDGAIGNIVVKAPYQDAIKAVFYGKAAHAGVDPEKGISSIRGAALAISKMKLGRIDEETTANIGIIQGGRAINIIPDETTIEGEARSRTLLKLKTQAEKMRQAIEKANSEVGTRAKIEVKRLYDGFSFSEKDKVVQTAMAALRRVGAKPNLVASGGGSDTNIFNKAGIRSVNLSCGAKDVHTIRENVSVDHMVKAAEIALALIRD